MSQAIVIYQIGLTILLLLCSPLLLFSRKARAGLSQKLGFVPGKLKSTLSGQVQARRIWFHAVSVGEFNALYPLLEEFRKRHPDFQIFVSTTTRTGQEQALNKVSSFAQVFYFPFDLPFALNNWLDFVRPELVAVVETEIWPAFMAECKQRKIKLVLINGRLSPRSFEGYKRWSWFFAPVVRSFEHICLQSEAEKKRFFELAGQRDPSGFTVSGNIKLDGIKACSAGEAAQLRADLGLKPSDFVLVAGSTHEGEELALLSLLKELNDSGAESFRLILVPRHPERFGKVAALIESMGFRACLFSASDSFKSETDVYLLDTIGLLNKYYSAAQLAFVGGTLAFVGGHNLAEPCIYKAPVICGTHVHKQKDMFQSLCEYGAIRVFNDAEELKHLVLELMQKKEERKAMGENGFRFLSDSQGALEKTLSVLEQYLNLAGAAGKQELESVGGARR